MDATTLDSRQDLSDDELREAIREGSAVLLRMREALDKGKALEGELPVRSLELRRLRQELTEKYTHGERVLLNLISEADARGLIDHDAPIGEFR